MSFMSFMSFLSKSICGLWCLRRKWFGGKTGGVSVPSCLMHRMLEACWTARKTAQGCWCHRPMSMHRGAMWSLNLFVRKVKCFNSMSNIVGLWRKCRHSSYHISVRIPIPSIYFSQGCIGLHPSLPISQWKMIPYPPHSSPYQSYVSSDGQQPRRDEVLRLEKAGWDGEPGRRTWTFRVGGVVVATDWWF